MQRLTKRPMERTESLEQPHTIWSPKILVNMGKNGLYVNGWKVTGYPHGEKMNPEPHRMSNTKLKVDGL